MDNLSSSIEPIVNLVPDFYYSKKLGNLIEANVSNGKLVICSMDIDTNLSTRPAARQLRYSILSYMAGTFNPPQVIKSLEGFKFDGMGNGATEYRAEDHQCFKDILVVRGNQNPTNQFDLLEIVQEVPRSQVEYPASIFGGKLGPYKV